MNELRRKHKENGYAERRNADNFMGAKVSIAGRTVIVERQIGEGGQATVLVARDSSGERYALKRMLWSDRSELRECEHEVRVHERLSHHPHVVKLFGHARKDPSGGSPGEVLLLMEYCPGNATDEAANRSAAGDEPWALGVFSQVCEVVAEMHSQSPPIAHRDIKIENVLLSRDGECRICDFGSATEETTPSGATREQLAKLEGEVSRCTTLDYRAPEMVDLRQRLPVNEKVDVWALGCLLYRLCFGTTPFEQSSLRILTANFSFPTDPRGGSRFSDGLRGLISSALVVNPDERPDVFHLYDRLCTLRGIPNKYKHLVKPPKVVVPPLPPQPQLQPQPQPQPQPNTLAVPDEANPKHARQRSTPALLEAITIGALNAVPVPASPQKVVPSVSAGSLMPIASPPAHHPHHHRRVPVSPTAHLSAGQKSDFALPPPPRPHSATARYSAEYQIQQLQLQPQQPLPTPASAAFSVQTVFASSSPLASSADTSFFDSQFPQAAEGQAPGCQCGAEATPAQNSQQSFFTSVYTEPPQPQFQPQQQQQWPACDFDRRQQVTQFVVEAPAEDFFSLKPSRTPPPQATTGTPARSRLARSVGDVTLAPPPSSPRIRTRHYETPKSPSPMAPTSFF